MKYIKLYETGEWCNYVDLDYVKKHPDDDSEEANWIKYLNNTLESIIEDLEDPNTFEIIDIKGFDTYQGPYAKVRIFDTKYSIWTIANDNDLWIENFPIDNTGSNNSKSGYQGTDFEIACLLNDINNSGGIDVYLNTKKYNL